MKTNLTVDYYEFILERINKNLFNEQTKLIVGYKFMSQWWWIYVLSPLIGTMAATLAYYYIFNQNKSCLWIVLIIVEVLNAILITYGIKYVTTSKERIQRVVIAVFLSIVLFSPWYFATKFEEAISTITGLSNFMLLIIGFGVVFTVICWIVATLIKIQVIYAELSKLFGPIIPATFGRLSPDIKTRMDKILFDEIGEFSTNTKVYEAVRAQAQSVIDSASVLILPWLTLLAIISIASKYISNFLSLLTTETTIWGSYIKNFGSSLNMEAWLQLFIVTIGILATLGIAKQAFINTIIIQSIARLSLRD